MLFDLSERNGRRDRRHRGAGGKLAEGLAEAGARVAVVGRNAGRGEACVQRIVKAGGQARFFPADAISRASLRQAAGQIEAALGAPTVLVNAAGRQRLRK